jgi:hypothetical protein
MALIAAPAAAQEPSLQTVMARTAAYVVEFHRQLSGIVAEETYVQDVSSFANRGGCPSNATYQSTLKCRGQLVAPVQQVLRSDLLLVKAPGTDDWLQFRDAFEVDGRPVRDRAERITKLFLEPSPSTREQLERIREESARHNIGDIQRNFNTPVFALKFLLPDNQPRFKFKRTNARTPATSGPAADIGAFRVATELWAIEFEETRHPTIVHTKDNKDLPSKGRFWIEPSTGRVMMSEFVAGDRHVKSAIDVSYQSEPLVGLLVPVEMREHYEDRSGSRIDAVATYGKFRQFQVKVDEKILPIK